MNILIMKDSARPADVLEKIVADQKTAKGEKVELPPRKICCRCEMVT